MATITIFTIDTLAADGYDLSYGCAVGVSDGATHEPGQLDTNVVISSQAGQGLQPNPPTVKTFS